MKSPKPRLIYRYHAARQFLQPSLFGEEFPAQKIASLHVHDKRGTILVCY